MKTEHVKLTCTVAETEVEDTKIGTEDTAEAEVALSG
jgi:hypothetical protein